jgi:hypothetical protein
LPAACPKAVIVSYQAKQVQERHRKPHLCPRMRRLDRPPGGVVKHVDRRPGLGHAPPSSPISAAL